MIPSTLALISALVLIVGLILTLLCIGGITMGIAAALWGCSLPQPGKIAKLAIFVGIVCDILGFLGLVGAGIWRLVLLF